jgi:hypothetical protein
VPSQTTSVLLRYLIRLSTAIKDLIEVLRLDDERYSPMILASTRFRRRPSNSP